MARKLRALLVEDSEDDALLVDRALRRGGFDVSWLRVETAESMSAALDDGPWDIVLSDFRMPHFGATEALRLHRARGLDTPFIIISGTIGEEQAVEALRAGAQDFFLKDRLTRLPSAIERELAEAENRRRRREAEEDKGRAAEALRESEARYRALVEHMADALVLVDPDQTILFVNPAACHLLGYAEDELLGQNAIAVLFHEDDRAAMEKRNRRRAEGTPEGYEIRVRRRSGELVWTRFSATAVSDAAGRATGHLAIITDISERKIAEQAILAEKAFSEAMLASLPGLVVLFDRDGKLLRWNRALERVTGHAAAELARMHPLDLVVEDDRGSLAQSIAKVFADGASDAEVALLAKDGRGTAHTVVGVRIALGGETCCLACGIDISGRRHLEDQLHQSQKFEAIGRLAGGVAHDFNNLLGVILGYGELALLELPEGNPARERVEEMFRAAERAAGLTKQLQAFGRKQIRQLRLLDINVLVSEARKMLDRVLGEDIVLTTDLAADLGTVRADSGQLEQILMNLVVNARDAMRRGGGLTIQTANVALGAEDVASHRPMPPGDYVRLTVSDTGAGMDSETLRRAFEPFFTTKPAGEGTGLGLSTVYGIVKQSDGYIWIESEPGRGTTFDIFLPRIAAPAESLTAEATSSAAPRGVECVLLVEDSPALREVLRERLAELGYDVLLAADGEQALEVAREHDAPIHLLLTDVVMPRLGGGELAHRLLALRPETRVLYMSGYTDGKVLQQGVVEEGVALLTKPFTRDQLAIAVRETLDRPGFGRAGS